MSAKPESAAPFVPLRPTLRTAKQAAADCKGCDLYRHATQTVFGEGRANATVVFVGEQPGDAEDLAGKPFVGPAGRVLDQALEAVGIVRDQVYVTNVVKHFKWGHRARAHQAARARVPRCHGGAGASWIDIQSVDTERDIRRITAGAGGDGNRSSVIRVAYADG